MTWKRASSIYPVLQPKVRQRSCWKGNSESAWFVPGAQPPTRFKVGINALTIANSPARCRFEIEYQVTNDSGRYFPSSGAGGIVDASSARWKTSWVAGLVGSRPVKAVICFNRYESVFR